MTFGVHNHTPEFAVIDGVLVYDELLRLTDPKVVVLRDGCGLGVRLRAQSGGLPERRRRSGFR